MAFRSTIFATVFGLTVTASFGGEPNSLPIESAEESAWEYTISTSVYIVRNEREFVNPTVSADHDWLHMEARYNYEAINTGSAWVGWNFSFGKELVFDATPMLGGVFGNLTGIAPGYAIGLTYKWFEFSTQGEFFFDAGNSDENFFYSWSEVSFAPVEWCRLGLAVDRSKALGTDIDIRRGPLLGFRWKNYDLTTYWLNPGSQNSAVIFALTATF